MNKHLLTATLCLAALAASAQSVAPSPIALDPVREAFDRANYARELRQQHPDMLQSPPLKERQYPLNADGLYKFAGYNSDAGGTYDAQAGIGGTPGVIQFNLTPAFEADSVFVEATLSPYSCFTGDHYTSFQPTYNASTGTYNSMETVRYDIHSWEKISSTKSRLSNGQNGIPYLPAYDPKTGLTFAISLSNPVSGGNDYDLNVWNNATNKLQRLSTLGEYNMHRVVYNAYKGLFSDGTNLYTYYEKDRSVYYLAKIDPITQEQTIIGKFNYKFQPYSNQAYWYCKEDGKYYNDHFNLYDGTTFYTFDPTDIDAEGYIKQEQICRPNTGYQNVYEIPADVARTPQAFDLKATGNADFTKMTISFTVPATMTDGTELTTADIILTVNEQPVSVTGTPGSKVTVEADAQDGVNIVTLRINDSWAVGTIFIGGYDAPGKVTDLVAGMQADGKVLLTWNAPTTSRYSDFGSLYDSSDITYTVVRNQDNHVVAEGITSTSCIDNEMPEFINSYTYSVYAVSHGNKGEGVVSDPINAGSYLQLPYSTAFDNVTDFDIYTVWSDMPYTTPYLIFNYNENYKYIFALGTSDGFDDWVATPKVKVTTDKVYTLEFDCMGQGRNFYATAGSEATSEALTTVFGGIENIGDQEWHHVVGYFTPKEDGLVNFAIHCTAYDKDYSATIDNIRIEEAMSTLAPDSITDIQYQNIDGELRGQLFFTLPEKNIKGEALSQLTKYEVYVNNELQKTVTDCQPGSAEEVEITGVKGFNEVMVVASNNSGAGLRAYAKVFVGPDVPAAVDNFKIVWGTSTALAHQVVLTWDAPTIGANGGYINPADLKYNIYLDSDDGKSKELITTVTGEQTFSYSFRAAGAQQKYLIFGVSAVNDEGEAVASRRSIVQGNAYSLPFSESFCEGLHSNVWTSRYDKEGGNLLFNYGVYNDYVISSDGDGFSIEFFVDTESDADMTLATPIIDFRNATAPVAKVWLYHTTDASPDSYFVISASVDGEKYEEITDRIPYSDNAGWHQHILPLTKVVGKRALIGFTGYMADCESKCFFDNVQICELTGKDLALTGISYDATKVAGTDTKVNVTVSNLGNADALDYEVMLYLGDEIIASEMPSDALAGATEKEITFNVPLNSATEESVKLHAELFWDGDEDESNNVSNELSIKPAVLALAAPSELTADDKDLAWNAPEEETGLVITEDFENYRAFTIDGFDGWTTYDGDQQRSSGFIMYYGVGWPHYNMPMAWMIWNPKGNGHGNAPAWAPYEGDKCLLNWNSTGYDINDRPCKEGVVNDDWLISPEVVGGTDVSFMSKATGCDNYGSTTFEILTSETDRELSSFELLQNIEVGADHVDEWREFSFTLPKKAKYVAIHSISNGFGTMIDNLTYTRAVNPVFMGYNVYNGSTRMNSEVLTEQEYKATKDGTYAVSAQYDLGESALSNKVEIGESGIREVIDDKHPAATGTYNLKGQRVGDDQRGFIIVNGEKTYRR